MKISDQGFTERISSQSNRVSSAADAGQGTASSSKAQGGSSDLLQLSSMASRLQNASSADAGASRAARVSQLAQVVSSGAFRIDPSKVSGALVSEALQSSGR
jgi:flagellar biosynthesis anti-sigma factor FlgM